VDIVARENRRPRADTRTSKPAGRHPLVRTEEEEEEEEEGEEGEEEEEGGDALVTDLIPTAFDITAKQGNVVGQHTGLELSIPFGIFAAISQLAFGGREAFVHAGPVYAAIGTGGDGISSANGRYAKPCKGGKDCKTWKHDDPLSPN
jgi:hypothetical protein